MDRTRSLAFVIGCALLASCGGGGSGSGPTTGGGGGGTGGGGGGGGGTPTPTPASYTPFASLTGTQTFATTCGGTTSVSGAPFLPNAVGGMPFGTGITIVSNRDVPNYEIESDGTGLFSTFATSFDQSNRDTTRTGEVYAKVNANGFTERFSIFALQENSVELEYVRIAQVLAQTVSLDTTNQVCVLGLPTELDDTPTSALTYSGLFLFGTATLTENSGAGPISTYRITSSVASAGADPATGEIIFTLELNGQLITSGGVSSDITNLGTFSGSTSIDGTQQGYSDLFVNAGNTVVGNFGGWFFGPQGRTAAISFTIQDRRPDDSDLTVGALAILRP